MSKNVGNSIVFSLEMWDRYVYLLARYGFFDDTLVYEHDPLDDAVLPHQVFRRGAFFPFQLFSPGF